MAFADWYQKLGLKLINSMAYSWRYHLNSGLKFGDKTRNKLDQYLVNNDVDRPTVLFFYGGNWRSGQRQDYRFVADSLTLHGFNVIIPDYRLYPMVRFEQIMCDAKQALRWTLDHVPSNQPIFIMGHSAGAQLGSLLCLNQSLAVTRADVGGETDKRIAGFVGLAGPYDFFPFTEDDHWDLFSPEADYALSQPVNFVRADAPPMYLLHGEDDVRVRRGHSKSLMEKIQAKGGQAAREVYPGMGHVDILLRFMRFHRSNCQVVSDITDFLKKHASDYADRLATK